MADIAREAICRAAGARRPSELSRWKVKFAELAETARGPRVPTSVASTSNVEVPGMEIVHDFISDAEAQQLVAAIDEHAWDTSIKRRVQHYGHAFDYARLRIAE